MNRRSTMIGRSLLSITLSLSAGTTSAFVPAASSCTHLTNSNNAVVLEVGVLTHNISLQCAAVCHCLYYLTLPILSLKYNYSRKLYISSDGGRVGGFILRRFRRILHPRRRPSHTVERRACFQFGRWDQGAWHYLITCAIIYTRYF